MLAGLILWEVMLRKFIFHAFKICFKFLFGFPGFVLGEKLRLSNQIILQFAVDICNFALRFSSGHFSGFNIISGANLRKFN